MTFEEFEKQASKCSQKAIMMALYNSSIRTDYTLSRLESYDYEIKSKELLKKSNELIEKQRALIGKGTLESMIEWEKLQKQWAAVHNKLDKLSAQFMKRSE